MTTIKPVYLNTTSGVITQMTSSDVISSSVLPNVTGGLYHGSATLDFGTGEGTNETSITVTGLTSITATAQLTAWVVASDTTSDHSASDHEYFAALVGLTCGTITPGDGFTIYARSLEKLTGTFTVRYSWQEAGVPTSSASTTAYVRPADWLTLPTLVPGDQKFVGLLAIYNHDSNFIALSCAGNYNVDWGDGTSANFSTGVTASHAYSWASISSTTLTSAGYKQVIVTVTMQGGQNMTSLSLHKLHPTVTTNYYNSPWLDIAVNSPNLATFEVAKNSLVNITNFTTLEKVTIQQNVITSFAETFIDLIRLQSVSISTAASSTSFLSTFEGCKLLKSVDPFDTSAGTTFSKMFNGSGLVTAPALNTSSGTNFSAMFYSCANLTYVPLLNTANGTSFLNMFCLCSSLKTVPVFNTSQGTNFSGMFSTSGLTTLPLIDLHLGTNLSDFCSYCKDIKTIPAYVTTSATNCSSMFQGMSSLTFVPTLNTASVTDFSSMFSACTSLVEAPALNMSSATTAAFMFNICSNLEIVPSLNPASCTSFGAMFYTCSKLKTVSINTASGTTFNDMFSGCISMITAPALITSNATNLSGMFSGCSSLQNVPLYNTASCTDFTNMFASCTSLQTLPAFNTAAGTNFFNMLDSCFSLSSAAFNGTAADISYNACKLSGPALDAIYTGLGTVSGKTITVTNNYGIASDTPTIATGKGWTVV